MSSRRSSCGACRRATSSDSSSCSCPSRTGAGGGMGGGALDVYRVCERMAALDLGLATSELATQLGSDPIRVGGTDAQKREYITRIAKDGVLFAYGATEPEAGSDLASLKTVAVPSNGGYKLSGVKQWI